MTTFGLILMAVFAFVAVLAKPLDPVKRAISEDMRDKKNAQPEKEEVEPKKFNSRTAHNGDTTRCRHYGLLCSYNRDGKATRSY